MATAEGQQHPISVYFWVWGLLFVLSLFSYMVDYFQFQGMLRWTLIIIFMLLKAGLIVSIFMHMVWERLALGPAHRVSNLPVVLAQPPIGWFRYTMSHFTLMRFLHGGVSCRWPRVVAHGSLVSIAPARSSVTRRHGHLRMDLPRPVFRWGSHHGSGLLAWGPITSRAIPWARSLTAQSNERSRNKAQPGSRPYD